MHYASSTRKPPRTLTSVEQARLLAVSGEHRDGFRDHVIFSLVLGTGLREMEVASLDVGDVSPDGRGIRRRVALRVFKRCSEEPAPQDVFLPDNVVYKLEKFLRWKRQRGEATSSEAPLFVSRKKARISTRTLREVFARWRGRAGLDGRHSLHGLRHSCLTNLYRETGDIRLVQRVARHKHIQTTTVYASPTDEDLFRATRELPC